MGYTNEPSTFSFDIKSLYFQNIRIDIFPLAHLYNLFNFRQKLWDKMCWEHLGKQIENLGAC
jgi:hypothetical protein